MPGRVKGRVAKWKARIDVAKREGKELLDLSSCGMSKEGRMEYLMEFLIDNKTVSSLWLYNNNIGPQGARFLSEGLKANQTLEMLGLIGNEICSEGLRHLAERLAVNRTLKELLLNYNDIDDEGLCFLSAALKVNQTAKILGLDGNRIGDEGLQHLTEAVRLNTSLVEVSVEKNDVTDDAKAAFTALLEDMPAREAAREDFLLFQFATASPLQTGRAADRPSDVKLMNTEAVFDYAADLTSIVGSSTRFEQQKRTDEFTLIRDLKTFPATRRADAFGCVGKSDMVEQCVEKAQAVLTPSFSSPITSIDLDVVPSCASAVCGSLRFVSTAIDCARAAWAAVQPPLSPDLQAAEADASNAILLELFEQRCAAFLSAERAVRRCVDAAQNDGNVVSTASPGSLSNRNLLKTLVEQRDEARVQRLAAADNVRQWATFQPLLDGFSQHLQVEGLDAAQQDLQSATGQLQRLFASDEANEGLATTARWNPVDGRTPRSGSPDTDGTDVSTKDFLDCADTAAALIKQLEDEHEKLDSNVRRCRSEVAQALRTFAGVVDLADFGGHIHGEFGLAQEFVATSDNINYAFSDLHAAVCARVALASQPTFQQLVRQCVAAAEACSCALNTRVAELVDARRRVQVAIMMHERDRGFKARRNAAEQLESDMFAALEEVEDAQLAEEKAALALKEIVSRVRRRTGSSSSFVGAMSIKDATSAHLNSRAAKRATQEALTKVVSQLVTFVAEFPEIMLRSTTEENDEGSFDLKEQVMFPLRDALDSSDAMVARALADYGDDRKTLASGAETRHAVFLATDPFSSGDRLVALKEFQDVSDPVHRRQFLREVALLRSCKHRHIAVCELVFFDTGGARAGSTFAYMQMPYYAGGTLDLWPERCLAMSSHRSSFDETVLAPSASDVVRVLEQIARAVCFLHERGIVHCDIKPQNILLEMASRSASAVLADFDVSSDTASRAQKCAEQTRTMTMNLRVTPAYAAPELSAAAAVCTTASDMFAFGKTLGVVLFGMAPHERALPKELSSKLAPHADADLTTAIVKHAHQLFDLLTRDDSSTRPGAATALEHDLFSTNRSFLAQPLATCHICFDDEVLESSGVRYTANKLDSRASSLFLCKDCFSTHVRVESESGIFVLAARSAMIPHPRDTSVSDLVGAAAAVPAAAHGDIGFFDDRTVALFASEEAYTSYCKAKRDVTEHLLQQQTEGEITKRVLAEIARRARETELERRVRKHRDYIVNYILTLRCPNPDCMCAFVDFDGCTALMCHQCRTGFCAWCLADCGRDAHDHVNFKCQVGGASLFPKASDLAASQAKQRAHLIQAYIERLLEEPVDTSYAFGRRGSNSKDEATVGQDADVADTAFVATLLRACLPTLQYDVHAELLQHLQPLFANYVN